MDRRGFVASLLALGLLDKKSEPPIEMKPASDIEQAELNRPEYVNPLEQRQFQQVGTVSYCSAMPVFSCSVVMSGGSKG